MKLSIKFILCLFVGLSTFSACCHKKNIDPVADCGCPNNTYTCDANTMQCACPEGTTEFGNNCVVADSTAFVGNASGCMCLGSYILSTNGQGLNRDLGIFSYDSNNSPGLLTVGCQYYERGLLGDSIRCQYSGLTCYENNISYSAEITGRYNVAKDTLWANFIWRAAGRSAIYETCHVTFGR
jgi:hypothetical protein